MHRVELKDIDGLDRVKISFYWFLMHRVELKVLMWALSSLKRERFLMHRVELKGKTH